MDIYVLVMGAGNVGKSSYLEKLSQQQNISDYISSEDKSSLKLTFRTNYGKIIFHLHEGKVSAIKKWDAIILMFDRTNQKSFEMIKTYYDIYKNNNSVIICGNKVDVKPYSVDRTKITDFLTNKSNLMYFDLSVLSNYNLYLPFLHLLRILVPQKLINIDLLNDREDLNKVQILS